jgi:lipopolysaccharide biosynthesis glycosyltransferase
MEQLFPNLQKVVFLDDDIVIQRDLSPLWEIDLGGKVNGAVETCKGEDEWVMSKRFRNYFNFSHPLVAKNLNPDECAWAYGMNIFDLRAWRKTNIRETYHSWLREVNEEFSFTCKLLYFCLYIYIYTYVAFSPPVMYFDFWMMKELKALTFGNRI